MSIFNGNKLTKEFKDAFYTYTNTSNGYSCYQHDCFGSKPIGIYSPIVHRMIEAIDIDKFCYENVPTIVFDFLKEAIKDSK